MILLAVIPAFVIGWLSTPVAVGMILALLPTYLLKATAAGIPVTLLEIVILGVTAGSAARMLQQRTRLRGFGKLTAPIVALVVIWIAATLFSSDLRSGLGALKAWLLEPLLVALMVRNGPRTSASRWIMVGGLLLGAVTLSIYGLVEKIFGYGLPPDGRLNSVFVPANYHAMLVAPIFALALALLRTLPVRSRSFRFVAVASGIIGLGLVLTESYGGYLGVGAAMIVLLATLPKRSRRIAIAFGMVAAAIVLLPQLGTEKFQLLGKLNERSSSSVRGQIWRSTLDIVVQHPALGIGPNEFEPFYREAVAKRFWPPLEWLVAQPHNLYLALASETGILGLGAFLWLVWAWWRVGIRPFSSLPSRPWALAALAAVIAILVHGLVDTPIIKNDLAVLFAFVLALPFVAQKSLDAKTPPSAEPS